MLSKTAKLLLVGTSFAPILITVAWINAVEGRGWPHGASYLAAGVLLVAVCLMLVREAARRLEVVSFSPKSVRTADSEILGFALVYLLPLVNTGSLAINPKVFWFVMVILGLVVWTTHSYHVNPLLGLFGFHFYEVMGEEEVSYVMITRRSLRRAGRVKQVVQLTEYMLLDVEGA